ncbi:MAG: hypothetical protein QM811_07830 [Pirellulales bacterium]
MIVVAPVAELNALETLVPPDVPFFASTRPDALGQLADALFHYSAANVVRICLEHPFIDPVLVDRLVTHAAATPSADYVGFCTRSGCPAIETPIGSYGELCKSKAIRIADRDATHPRDREEPTRSLYRRPERFQASFLALPDELDRRDVRLALEENEDWDVMHELCDALGEEPDWRDVTEYLSSQPRIRSRMAAMNAGM